MTLYMTLYMTIFVVFSAKCVRVVFSMATCIGSEILAHAAYFVYLMTPKAFHKALYFLEVITQ